VRVGGASALHPSAVGETPTLGVGALSLSEETSGEPPEPLPMYGIDRTAVEQLIRDNGGTVLHLEIDERCGKEWVGYRYFVRKA